MSQWPYYKQSIGKRIYDVSCHLLSGENMSQPAVPTFWRLQVPVCVVCVCVWSVQLTFWAKGGMVLHTNEILRGILYFWAQSEHIFENPPSVLNSWQYEMFLEGQYCLAQASFDNIKMHLCVFIFRLFNCLKRYLSKKTARLKPREWKPIEWMCK